jgi:hypothetical protein
LTADGQKYLEKFWFRSISWLLVNSAQEICNPIKWVTRVIQID